MPFTHRHAVIQQERNQDTNNGGKMKICEEVRHLKWSDKRSTWRCASF